MPTASRTIKTSRIVRGRNRTSRSGGTRRGSYPAPRRGYDRNVSNSRLVYSTDGGDHRREEAKPRRPGRDRQELPSDGVVRIFREKGGRGGKTVTVVRGLPAGDTAVVAADLKRLCGAGGAVKDGAVELQGDHREKVAARLESRGYRVKLAGG